jgi:hypothetical protein
MLCISAWGVIKTCASAEIAEAMACFQGTKAILTEAVMPIQLDSDCANVVRERNAGQ